MALQKIAKAGIAALVLVAAVVAFVYLSRPESSASRQSTNDAYVQADFTLVAPRISGVVTEVLVEDNQPVNPGDLLATIDNRDFAIALDAAKAQVAAAEADITNLERRLELQESVIQQAEAALVADGAALRLAEVNAERYGRLAADNSGTLLAMQQAEAELQIAIATRDSNEAALRATRQELEVLNADLEGARAALARARTVRAAAELQLSYTRIIAPIGGVVGHRSVRVGAFINAGKPLLAIIPLEDIYITANFRETQLARVQVGQPVEIRVDAFPGKVLTGTVDSLGPASGVSYSLIAPHNATGNFTKIVQRLPVRIRIDPGQRVASRLRVGMSVQPEIDVTGAGGGNSAQPASASSVPGGRNFQE